MNQLLRPFYRNTPTFQFWRHKTVATNLGIHFRDEKISGATYLLLFGADGCACKFLSQHDAAPMDLDATKFVSLGVINRDAALAMAHDFTQRFDFKGRAFSP